MNTTAIPATENEGWGYWGTMGGYASVAWPLAMRAIARATAQPLASVRAFLDSRYGRYFADDVHSAMYTGQPLRAATATATRQWMQRTITRRTNNTHDIPVGLPHLTGFVLHCARADELEAI